MKYKKAEINQQTLIILLSIVLFYLFVVLLMRSCEKVNDKSRSIVVSDLELGLRSASEILSLKEGAIKNFKFVLPEETGSVCFIDLRHKDLIIKNTTLIKDYPIINGSLNSANSKNVFLIKNNKISDILYGGNICFESYPFYSCMPAQDNILDVWFEGRAGCAYLYINWSSFPENHRKSEKYSGNYLFVIQERMNDSSIDNWREISSGTTLTLFSEGGKTYFYNYSVVYKPEAYGEIGFDNLKLLMDSYKTKKAYLFDSTTQSQGGGYLIETISANNPNTYFGFWSNYSSVILVDRNNHFSAVIGSLLASYVNAPIIFIDKSNLDSYKNYIHNKQVFVVTHGPIKLDDDTHNFVKQYSSRYISYSDTLIQSEGTIPTFARLYSKVKIG